MYRLNVAIGTALTSACYEKADESGALQLSPFARELSSAQFLADGRVEVDSLAETLRGIVVTANQHLREAPATVGVTHPASWDPSQLLLLWEALVLAGIPDADTEPGDDPQATVLTHASQADPEPSPVDVAPARRKKGGSWRSGWLVGAAALTVVAGVTAGVIAAGLPRASQMPDATQNSGHRLPPRPRPQPARPGAAGQHLVSVLISRHRLRWPSSSSSSRVAGRRKPN
jgi:hypothetical protein